MAEKKQAPMAQLSEQQKAATIPYFVHEGEMYRAERMNRRWFISFLIVLAMLFASNLAWVIYENQFETFSYEIQQDSGQGGNNTYTGNTVRMVGGSDYGEAGSQDNDPQAGQDIQQPGPETLP